MAFRADGLGPDGMVLYRSCPEEGRLDVSEETCPARPTGEGVTRVTDNPGAQIGVYAQGSTGAGQALQRAVVVQRAGTVSPRERRARQPISVRP